jgi:hypothetical protein
VTIIDAQQIARWAIGASVTNAAALTAAGDVNGDGVVDILDAQGIARFAVSLSAPPRVNAVQDASPPVKTLVVNNPTMTRVLGDTGSLVATALDANGFSVTGCQPITWASSDPSRVAVNASGSLTMVATGTATVTATSGGATATSNITVTVPDAATALHRLRDITAGGNSQLSSGSVDGIWLLSGLLADEWKSSSLLVGRDRIDQRVVNDRDSLVQANLLELYHTRSDARNAVAGMIAAGTGSPAERAQMYFVEGYIELLLGDDFCNGIPFNTQVGGLIVGGPPTSDAFTRAIAHFDSALTLATGGDPLSITVASDAKIAKGRALLQLGRPSDAATAVAGIPTTFQDLSTLATGETNKLSSLNFSAKEYSVADNPDIQGPNGNALNFASAADTRVPVVGSTLSPTLLGEDGRTNFVYTTLFTAAAATPLLSGIDARLIEAEAKLQANDIAGMMSVLNTLRASAQNLGGYTAPIMVALAPPPTQSAGADLLFRERAFWTFGRGQRLGDMRRLVRFYGRTPDGVFPVGFFFKSTGTATNYGSTINFPVSIDESGNSLPTVCVDRNP